MDGEDFGGFVVFDSAAIRADSEAAADAYFATKDRAARDYGFEEWKRSAARMPEPLIAFAVGAFADRLETLARLN